MALRNRLALALLLTLLPLRVATDTLLSGPIMRTLGAGGAPPSYLIEEDCEGTGTPSGWTDSGTIDWDDTTAPAPLEGAQSFHNVTTTSYSYFTLGGDVTEVWFYCMVNPESNNADNDSGIVELWEAGFAGRTVTVFYDSIDSSVISVASGTSIATTVATMTEGTTFHLWGHYLKGPGAADDIAEIWFSATSTKPADASNNHAKITDGDADTAIRIFLIGDDGGGPVNNFDHIRVDDAAIGSAPP